MYHNKIINKDFIYKKKYIIYVVEGVYLSCSKNILRGTDGSSKIIFNFCVLVRCLVNVCVCVCVCGVCVCVRFAYKLFHKLKRGVSTVLLCHVYVCVN